jgi:hypothetical protein
MNVTAAIDQVVARTANLGSADAGYANLRTMILEFLTQEFEWYWTARQWKRRRASTTVTVTSGSGELPTNFSSLGTEGGVWNTNTGRELREISEDELRLINLQPGYSVSDPRYFTIYGLNTSDFTYEIHVETNSSALSLTVAYNIIPPTLDEDTGVDNLKYIPEHFHQSVVIPAVRSHMLWKKGEQSWEDHEKQRLRGLDHMIREERRRQGSGRQFPSFFGGRL